MAVEIRVPQLAESISEATVGKWSAKAGDTVYLTPDKARIHRFNEQGLAI